MSVLSQQPPPFPALLSCPIHCRYGAARTLCNVPAVVAQQRSRRQAGRDGLPADARQLMDRVVDASGRYGAGHEVVAQGGLGEECERVSLTSWLAG